MLLAAIGCQGEQDRQRSQTVDAASSAEAIQNRIAEVENKLTPPIVIEGTEQAFHSLAEQMEVYRAPGVSIAVINDGRIEWAKGYGTREAGTDSPVDANTLFQAASISKSVSAMGALHWVHEGALELDRNINDFLVSWQIPENEFARVRPVTLRYLLAHGAGVSGHSLGTYYKGEEVPTFLQILDGMPPSKADPVRVVAEPQTEFKYSGGGYLIVLQAMIDVIGQPFPDIMRESVLMPVGMERSGYFRTLEHGSAENVAAGHDGMGSVIEGYWQIMPNPAGGGLWTTPSELCLFAIEVQKALRGESTIISREIAEEMLTGQMGDYGLGLILQGEGEDLAFSHGGDNAGYGSFFFAYARRGQGVAVMTNSENGHYLYNEILRSVGVVYDWPGLKPSVIKPLQLTQEALNGYTGRYLWNKALVAEITIENGHLRMEGDDGRVFLFYADSDNHFYDLYSGWELSFVFDEENEVTGALLSIAAEAVIRGEKTSS
jgi:CubicO group peptidase (beta-lactamase class C family)